MDDKILGKQGLRALLSAISNKLKNKVNISQLQTAVSDEVTIKLAEAKESGEFDGTTPNIGENGNWYVGNIDTGVSASGEVDAATVETSVQNYFIKNPINIPDKLSDLGEDVSHRLVTDAEKETWNNKSDFTGSYMDLTDKPFGEEWKKGFSAIINREDLLNGDYEFESSEPCVFEGEYEWHLKTDGEDKDDYYIAQITVNPDNQSFDIILNVDPEGDGCLYRVKGNKVTVDAPPVGEGFTFFELYQMYKVTNKIDKENLDIADWVKSPTKPNYTASEVGALPETTSIPTKTSDLENDSNFLTEHQSLEGYVKEENLPTTLPASDVHEWAKAETKPTYTAAEVGALPANTVIPKITIDTITSALGYTPANPANINEQWKLLLEEKVDLGLFTGMIADGNGNPRNLGEFTKLSSYLYIPPTATCIRLSASGEISIPEGIAIQDQDILLNLYLSTSENLGPLASKFNFKLNANKHTAIRVLIENKGQYSIKLLLSESDTSFEDAMSKPVEKEFEVLSWYANSTFITAPIERMDFTVMWDDTELGSESNISMIGGKLYLYGVNA